jgi:hypothetical protein
MRSSFLGAVAVAVALAAAPAPAADTALVFGQVTDPSGAHLPGATVTARNLDTGISRALQTASDGTYRLPALPPGRYDVSVELAGFAAARRSGLTLRLGAEVMVDFQLQVAGLSEEVTIVGDAPLVETTSSTVQTTVGREQIDVLPLIGRDYLSLLSLAPGVAGESILGSRERSNSFLIDGVDNSEDISGLRRQQYNLDAIQEFQVVLSSFKAEFGRASGGVVNVLTRSGTNELHGSAFFLYRDQGMIARNPFVAPDAPKDPFRRRQWGGTLGGPLVRDKTHFFATFDYEDRDTNTTSTEVYPRPGQAVSPATQAFLRQHQVPAFPDTSRGTSVRLVRPEYVNVPKLTTRLDHALSNRHVLTLRFNYERNHEPSGRGGTVFDADGNTATFRTLYGSLSHKWVRSSTQLNELYLQVGQSQGDWTAAFPTLPNISIDEGLGIGGSTSYPQARTDYVYQLIDNYTIHLPNAWRGSHVLKLGGDAKIFESESFFDSNFRGTFFFTTVESFLAGRPRRFTQNQGDSRLDRPNGIYGLYVQDDWRVSRRLTLNLGLRYDYEGGKTEALKDVNGSAACGVLITCGRPGPGISGDKNNVSPRLGFNWDPWGTGRTVVHGGTGAYYDQVILNVQGNARFTPPKVVGIQIENPTFPDPFQGGTPAALRPNISVIDEGLTTPRNWNTSLGVRREITRNLAADVSLAYNRGDGHVVIVNTNTIDPATRARPNPDFTNISLYTNEGRIRYRALLLELQKRLSGGYSFSVAYTLSKGENNSETIFSGIQDPRDLGRSYGPGDADRRHRLVASSLLRLPWGLDLGQIFEFRSEAPLNVVATGRDLNGDGVTGDWPEGYSRNSARQLTTAEANRLRALFGLSPIEGFEDNPTFWKWDATVQKRVRLGGSRALKLSVEVFNVLNHPNLALPVQNVVSANFGRRTAVNGDEARPRSIQVTAQVDF